MTRHWLREHSEVIFVFGDNTLREGCKGAAVFRTEPNSYGFITKRYPNYTDAAYFTPEEYLPIYQHEIALLITAIRFAPEKKFYITRLGSGLANKFGIYENVIQPNIFADLAKYSSQIVWLR